MDSSNKAIAKRINELLVEQGLKPTDLLRKIIEFKNPHISKPELNAQIKTKKGNFSTALKGSDKRSVTKEELFIISKVLNVSLEYIWFGEEDKKGFRPSGARYVAYQDNDTEYRTYIANLRHMDDVQYEDEFGFCLFDYLGQNKSIHGFKFYLENFKLHFDYSQYGVLMYINCDGYPQLCTAINHKDTLMVNLLKTLIKYNDTNSFKKIFFDNCSTDRFNWYNNFNRNKNLFADDFLKLLLNNESFLKYALYVKELNLNAINEEYDKTECRNFLEPMFFEVLSFALEHEDEYKSNLRKLLTFARDYNKSQYELVRGYLKTHSKEYGDITICENAPRYLRSANYVPMGNIINSNAKLSDEALSNLLSEIERYAFNITHIKKEQERSNDELKIVTPNNPLFDEIYINASKQNINFIPTIIHSDKEFTYYQFYNQSKISFNDPEVLKLVIEFLNRAQALVSPKANKVLVHGNLRDQVLMIENGDVIGLAGWHKCHYGSKYEDRIELLSQVEFPRYNDDGIQKTAELFAIISTGFNKEEQERLLIRTLDILNEEIELVINNENRDIYRVERLMNRLVTLQLVQKIYLKK